MDKKAQALFDKWWETHRFDCGKHALLATAFDEAERALGAAASDDLDARLAAYDAASTLMLAYDERVWKLRVEFDRLEHENSAVDPCACAENASGVSQDGHSVKDIEYWEVMLACAREQIDTHKPTTDDLSM